MKIVIIGRTETLYSTMEMALSNGHKIVGIVTCKEAPEYKVTREDYKNFAHENNIPFLATAKLHTEEALKFLNELDNPDISISMNFSGIISQTVTDMFPLGILNAHGGDLPRYRGNACAAWAIINGEDKIGLCIHRMIGGELDNGDIIERNFFPIDINTRIEEFFDWWDVEIPRLFIEAIKNLEKNPSYILESQSTNAKDALRCYPRNPLDGNIDWSSSATKILRLINASSTPFSGAFTTYNGLTKVIILRAEIIDINEQYCAIPGQIARITKNGDVVVLTGDGELKITLIQYNEDSVKPNKLIKSLRDRFI
jgi:methionyl-tRNA formyltransferase